MSALLTLNITIYQDEIYAILWNACDTFCGMAAPSEYKNSIPVMLFLKFICDVWLDHYDLVKQQFGDNEARIRRRMERERFGLPASTDYYSLYE